MATTVKTAFSLRKELFEEGEKMARKQHISRSALYARALEDYLANQKTANLVREINAVYGENPAAREEIAFLRAAARQAMKRVEW